MGWLLALVGISKFQAAIGGVWILLLALSGSSKPATAERHSEASITNNYSIYINIPSISITFNTGRAIEQTPVYTLGNHEVKVLPEAAPIPMLRRVNVKWES